MKWCGREIFVQKNVQALKSIMCLTNLLFKNDTAIQLTNY